MQLRLNPDELNLVADLLMQRTGEPYASLLEMVLARDLSFDSGELETLADLLAAEKRKLKELLANEADGICESRLQATLAQLDHAQERVSEACVMF